MAKGVANGPEQFWAMARRDPGGCLLWQGTLDKDGYGRVSWQGRKVRAHRLSFYLTRGRWPIGQGRHSCDTPRCIEPKHVGEGTPLQNAGDRAERARTAAGARNGRAKLTPLQVEAIRGALASGAGVTAVAREHGLHHKTVQDIRAGVLWGGL